MDAPIDTPLKTIAVARPLTCDLSTVIFKVEIGQFSRQKLVSFQRKTVTFSRGRLAHFQREGLHVCKGEMRVFSMGKLVEH